VRGDCANKQDENRKSQLRENQIKKERNSIKKIILNNFMK